MSKELQLKVFRTGELRVNAYLVFDEQTKEGFLVDCPAPIDEYSDFIVKKGLNMKFLVITHGHYDHIDGLKDFLQKFQIPFYIGEKDSSMLVNPMENGSLMGGNSVVIQKKPEFLTEGQKIPFANQNLEIIETSGHSRGGICIKFMDWLFSGDTLFYHTVGRTDLPFSDFEELQKSIKEKIFILNPKIIVYPGHGKKTSVGEEIKNNPFF